MQTKKKSLSLNQDTLKKKRFFKKQNEVFEPDATVIQNLEKFRDLINNKNKKKQSTVFF